MPTSQLYDSTRTTLAAHLPAVRASQLDTLALVVVGITQSVSAQLGKIARALPLDTTPQIRSRLSGSSSGRSVFLGCQVPNPTS
jgi:hypothetical protein